MEVLMNKYRAKGLGGLDDIPVPSTNADAARALLARCPRAAETPLVHATGMARELGLGALWIKDERERMGLGSFKALGAAYAIAQDAEAGKAAGATYVCASAGNHGLSVAAGAAAFGANAVIFLCAQVPEGFAGRLRAIGAEVVRAGEIYEESLEAAHQWAADGGGLLLSDTSWPGYTEMPYRVMEGYLALMAEAAEQIDEPPTHVMLQAGVGGLAGAGAAFVRSVWGDGPRVAVVEPETAPALIESIRAGRPVQAAGPVSHMGRLDCKEPSLIALKGLSRDADAFVTITEDEGQSGADFVARHGMASTTSGAAGVAALVAGAGRDFGIGPEARVLAILSEGPER